MCVGTSVLMALVESIIVSTCGSCSLVYVGLYTMRSSWSYARLIISDCDLCISGLALPFGVVSFFIIGISAVSTW